MRTRQILLSFSWPCISLLADFDGQRVNACGGRVREEAQGSAEREAEKEMMGMEGERGFTDQIQKGRKTRRRRRDAEPDANTNTEHERTCLSGGQTNAGTCEKNLLSHADQLGDSRTWTTTADEADHHETNVGKSTTDSSLVGGDVLRVRGHG